MNESTVALYARVSSEQQAEDGTIESQIAALRERIQQDGYRLSEEMVFIDNGYSGTTLIRPALERLRDTVALHGLNRLYVLCPDRLARKYAYQVLLIEEFQEFGVEMVFLNHTAGETAEDHLLLQMQGMIAEYERAKILERSRRGKRHAHEWEKCLFCLEPPMDIGTSASEMATDRPDMRSKRMRRRWFGRFTGGWGSNEPVLVRSVGG